MSGMGPAPKADGRRRRRNTAGIVQLPAEGRDGPLPEWPMAGRATKAELAVWAEMWSAPQAVVWEQMRAHRSVARYCRALVASEKKDATAALLNEVRQLEDRLGLTPMSMLRLGWQIVEDELAEQRSGQEKTDVRERLRAVDG